MDFLSSLPQIASAIGEMFISLFTSVSAIFYTPGSGTGDTAVPGQLTFIGVLALVVLFIGLCMLLANWVRSLIARR